MTIAFLHLLWPFLLSNSSGPPKTAVPVTVLSGFLGSGKTTLLQHLLMNNRGQRIALVVNDVASVNIDSKLLARSSSAFATEMSSAGIVQLSNGCACCTLSDQLLTSISELITLSDMKDQSSSSSSSSYDHIVVELSGVSEPKKVRANFQEATAYQMPLMERVRLDTMVTMIDASTFLYHLQSDAQLQEKNKSDTPKTLSSQRWDGSSLDLPPGLIQALKAAADKYDNDSSYDDDNHTTETVAQLLTQQVECADVILINKVDLLSNSQLEETSLNNIIQIVQAFNPHATIYTTSFAQIDSLDLVLGAAQGQGVVQAGIIDDHKEAVYAAQVLDRNTSDSTDTDDATTHSPTHTHHDHNSHVCTNPDCNDPSHTHDHSHHSHSVYSGLASYVYNSRRPFHPKRLNHFLRHFKITKAIDNGHVQAKDTFSSFSPSHPTLPLDQVLQSTCQNILRSKGFTWLAHSSIAAYYWSHAGTSFDMQCLGRWWVSVPRQSWPMDSISLILADFDKDVEDTLLDPSTAVGDRRQEIVFIGYGINQESRQNVLRQALDACLLTDEEMMFYNKHQDSKQEIVLKDAFPLPFTIKMMDY